MPKALADKVKFVEGGKTNSVADQKEIKKHFPGTYGMPIITYEDGGKNVLFRKLTLALYYQVDRLQEDTML